MCRFGASIDKLCVIATSGFSYLYASALLSCRRRYSPGGFAFGCFLTVQRVHEPMIVLGFGFVAASSRHISCVFGALNVLVESRRSQTLVRYHATLWATRMNTRLKAEIYDIIKVVVDLLQRNAGSMNYLRCRRHMRPHYTLIFAHPPRINTENMAYSYCIPIFMLP